MTNDTATQDTDQMTARSLAHALYVVETHGKSEETASWEDSKADMVVKARRVMRILATRGVTVSISKEAD